MINCNFNVFPIQKDTNLKEKSTPYTRLCKEPSERKNPENLVPRGRNFGFYVYFINKFSKKHAT